MRSAEFDKQQVLRDAIKLFSHKGYSQTSMQDLKKATGLHPGSIYCAFENKQGLLISALDQYTKDRSDEYLQLFSEAPNVKEGIKRYLDGMLDELTDKDEVRVCLTLKALGEMSAVDDKIAEVVDKNIRAWKQGFVGTFSQAIANGEMDNSRSAEQRAQYFVMGIYGLRTYAQTTQNREELDCLAHQVWLDVCR